MASVSIIVPTYRRPDVLRLTLEALVSLDYPASDYEVLVVDDANDPATATVVADARRDPVRLALLRHDGHGAAAARNAGARAAGGDVLLFCDDDMVVAPNHLRLHMETRRRFGDVLVGGERWYSSRSLAALQATPFGRFRVQLEAGFRSALEERLLDSSCVETSTLASCDLSIGRGAFWKIGGFDDSFPYAGAEDQDLCLRAIQAGHRLVRNRSVKPLHNDPTVTLRQFCEREQRGAHTVVALTRKHPELLGDFAANAPLAASDSVRLKTRKLIKTFLSRDVTLSALHRVVRVLEVMRMPDRALAFLYHAVIGLHTFRGYREALQRTSSQKRTR